MRSCGVRGREGGVGASLGCLAAFPIKCWLEFRAWCLTLCPLPLGAGAVTVGLGGGPGGLSEQCPLCVLLEPALGLCWRLRGPLLDLFWCSHHSCLQSWSGLRRAQVSAQSHHAPSTMGWVLALTAGSLLEPGMLVLGATLPGGSLGCWGQSCSPVGALGAPLEEPARHGSPPAQAQAVQPLLRFPESQHKVLLLSW